MLKTLDSRKPDPRRSSLMIDGRTMPVTLKRNRNARRIILRLDPKTEGIVLTVPWTTSFEAALEFAASQAAWIWAQSRRMAGAGAAASPGASVPLRGVEHAIVHRGGARRPVWPRASRRGFASRATRPMPSAAPPTGSRPRPGTICGPPPGPMRRAWNVQFASLTVRDTSSRWGSCSSTAGAVLFLAPGAGAALRARLRGRPRGRPSHRDEPRPGVLDPGRGPLPARRRGPPLAQAHGRALHRYGAAR
jgi:hypothetical protein